MTAKTEKAMSRLRTVAGEVAAFEEAEGCAGVEHVREAEEAGDDGARVADTDVVHDPELGPAVERDDDDGDDESDDAGVPQLFLDAGTTRPPEWEGS